MQVAEDGRPTCRAKYCAAHQMTEHDEHQSYRVSSMRSKPCQPCVKEANGTLTETI